MEFYGGFKRFSVRKIRLLIVDDHAVLRAGIRHIMQRTPDIQVVGEACNGVEALQMVASLAPDVMLLDMEMPVLNGIDVARRLHAESSPVHILVLSAYNDRPYIHELLKNGVAGYMTKDEAPRKIVEAIRKVSLENQDWASQQSPSVASVEG
jgi:DNA-binding NarL/FixJ family response regulator